MNFLKIADGVYVNTANILKFVTTADSVTIHLVGQTTPVSLITNDPAGVAQWLEWLKPNTVNLAAATITK